MAPAEMFLIMKNPSVVVSLFLTSGFGYPEVKGGFSTEEVLNPLASNY